MKNFLKQICRKVGYEFHKSGYCTDPINIGTNNKNSFPYIEDFQFDNFHFKFWVANEDGKKMYQNTDVDKEIACLINATQPSDRIIEIGTHHGFFTVLLGKVVGPKGFVLGLEALPANTLIAQSQITLNELWNVCKIKNVAASDSDTTVNLTRMSSNASVMENNCHNTMTLNAVPADSYLQKYGTFNAIKIDVEGYEYKVLKGCKQILSTRPKLFLELHIPFLKTYKTTVSDIFTLINIKDYEGFMVPRTDKTKVLPFNPHNLPNDVVNLILKPKIIN